MSSSGKWPPRGPIVVAGVLVLGLVSLALSPEPWQRAAALQREAVAHGQWWRLWTAHLVHFGWRHALWDGLPLALLALSGPKGGGTSRWWSVGALLCAPGIGLGVLLLQPGVTEYRGASGLVVWGAVVLAVQAWRLRTLPRPLLLALAVALAGKLAWDAIRSSGSGVLPDGVVVAWSAHLAGALFGLAWGAAVRTAPDR